MTGHWGHISKPLHLGCRNCNNIPTCASRSQRAQVGNHFCSSLTTLLCEPVGTKDVQGKSYTFLLWEFRHGQAFSQHFLLRGLTERQILNQDCWILISEVLEIIPRLIKNSGVRNKGEAWENTKSFSQLIHRIAFLQFYGQMKNPRWKPVQTVKNNKLSVLSMSCAPSHTACARDRQCLGLFRVMG